MMKQIHRSTVLVNNTQFSILTAGDATQEAILLLHGFPEDAMSFQKEILFLADLGFYVVAPDQRGHGESHGSDDLLPYRLDHLALDIHSILDHFKLQTVQLIGHDWGGVVSWYLISSNPTRFKSALIMCAPHWKPFRKNLLSNPRQLMKSWYMFFIQLPKLPELLFGLNQYLWFAGLLRRSSKLGNYPKGNLDRLRKSWIQRKGMSHMLNWYRAMRNFKEEMFPKIHLPVTVLWGKSDPYLNLKLAEESLKECSKGTLHILENVGHWPHHEDPEALHEVFKVHLKVR